MSISVAGPALEGVLGPLSASVEFSVRSSLVAMGADLQLAAGLVDGRVGWMNGGLELRWMQSGQTDIGATVGSSDAAGSALVFGVELRPSWFYGTRSETLSWTVESWIEVNCQHATDHQSMHAVAVESVTVSTVSDAITVLRRYVDQLVQRVAAGGYEQWTALGAD